MTPTAPKARTRSPSRDWSRTNLRKGADWRPELVGSVRGYPKTREAFEARRAAHRAQIAEKRAAGLMTRMGVPDGYGGRRTELEVVRAEARETAAAVRGRYDPVEMGMEWEAQAADVLQELLTIALDRAQHPDVRLQAGRVFLSFVRPKPVQRTDVRLDDPTDFLRALARD